MIHWFFVILKCEVLYYKLLSRKFCDKNFHDHCEIHENHENIWPQKFGAIRYNVSYNTSLLLEQVWRGYNQAPEKYSAVNIEIGISQNTNCAIWNGFPKSSHIYY